LEAVTKATRSQLDYALVHGCIFCQKKFCNISAMKRHLAFCIAEIGVANDLAIVASVSRGLSLI